MNRSATIKQSIDESALAGLRHLENSAQLFLTTSPALSAHLGFEKNSLSAIHNILSKDCESNKLCQACGSILIPGWSCKKYRPRSEPKPRKIRQKAAEKASKPGKAKVAEKDHIALQCDLCHSVTRFMVPEKRPKPAASRVIPKATTSTDNSTPSPIVTPEAIATQPSLAVSVPEKSSVKSATDGAAKKRSKKNKAGGLAALLAKSKSESASPSSFDLMDFMKTA